MVRGNNAKVWRGRTEPCSNLQNQEQIGRLVKISTTSRAGHVREGK